jgi:hypothetical protein
MTAPAEVNAYVGSTEAVETPGISPFVAMIPLDIWSVPGSQGGSILLNIVSNFLSIAIYI